MIQTNIPTAQFPRCLWVTSLGRRVGRVATAHEVDTPSRIYVCVCVCEYADMRVAHRGLCPDRFMWRYDLIYENVHDNAGYTMGTARWRYWRCECSLFIDLCQFSLIIFLK